MWLLALVLHLSSTFCLAKIQKAALMTSAGCCLSKVEMSEVTLGVYLCIWCPLMHECMAYFRILVWECEHLLLKSYLSPCLAVSIFYWIVNKGAFCNWQYSIHFIVLIHILPRLCNLVFTVGLPGSTNLQDSTVCEWA